MYPIAWSVVKPVVLILVVMLGYAVFFRLSDMIIKRQSEKQRLALRRELERITLDYRKHMPVTIMAMKRARKLLISYLDDQQRRELEKRGGFAVMSGGDTYWIQDGNLMRVNNRKQGIVRRAYCIVSYEEIIPDDKSLAIMLAIQADPQWIARTPNDMGSPYHEYVAWEI